MFDYTFVIPHKNTPELLEKCLDSIPVWDEVQVIIVDDNSSPDIVDFEHFPGLNRKNTIVVFDKSGKGAGNARNIALSKIENTKWLVFSDSDDYFTSYLSDAMKKYVDSDFDMVYFKRHSVYEGTEKTATRHQKVNSRVDYALQTGDDSIIRYKDLAPVCKFISYRLVKDNDITFEAIRYGNDAMFFVQLSHYINKLKIDPNVIYVVTERKDSLIKTYSKEAVVCRYYASARVIAKQKEYGLVEYHPNLFAYCDAFSKINPKLALIYFFKSLYYTPVRYWYKDILACFKVLLKK